MNRQLLYIIVILAMVLSAFARGDQERLRRHFLVLSSNDESPDAREAALHRLARAGEDAVIVSLEFIGRKSPDKRTAIARVALAVGENAVVPLTNILSRPDESEAAFAAEILGEIGSPKASVPLLLAARSSSEKLRTAAIGAIGNCGDSLAIPTLLEALADPNPRIRRNSAVSLGKIGHSSAIPALVPLLGDSSALVAYAVSEAIARIGDGDALDLLKQRLDDNSVDELERYHIIETVGMFRNTESIPLLLDLLEDPSHLNRGFACQALGYFRGNYRVANALKRARNDSSAFVRMMAEQSLMVIRHP
ncbi:MAG TPA: HEAT repeat domain-containing protein [candidate division Zixibacteria bacterium]|nr:HEAT repeat domain-containing protein [candidate division Zixibacteria bacterium]